MEIHRIQIKTTTTEIQGKPGKYALTLNRGADSASYDADTIDFFGLVILPLHTIYIVPQESLDGRVKAYVYPLNSESTGQLEVYRENWNLL